jgi:hypothetical protein
MMGIRATNWSALEKRGARLDNADFVVVKCEHCGAFALYEEERMQIYLSPENLANGSLYGFEGAEPVACSTCGAVDSFVEAGPSDIAVAESGRWAFASPFTIMD